jgi:hypothetical protein
MYVESMGRTLLNLFKSYYAQLLKQDLVIATKGDLIAVEEATLKNMFTQKVRIFLSDCSVTVRFYSCYLTWLM